MTEQLTIDDAIKLAEKVKDWKKVRNGFRGELDTVMVETLAREYTDDSKGISMSGHNYRLRIFKGRKIFFDKENDNLLSTYCMAQRTYEDGILRNDSDYQRIEKILRG